MLGAALLFKQWALWPAIPIVLAAPPGRRSLTAFYWLGAPGPDPRAVPRRELGHMVEPFRDTREPRLRPGAAVGESRVRAPDGSQTPRRCASLWGAAALVVASRVRRRPDVDTLLAAVGAVMLLRLLFEPVLFGYYLVPPAVLAVIWCAAQRPAGRAPAR